MTPDDLTLLRDYAATQVQAIADKMDELLQLLKRL